MLYLTFFCDFKEWSISTVEDIYFKILTNYIYTQKGSFHYFFKIWCFVISIIRYVSKLSESFLRGIEKSVLIKYYFGETSLFWKTEYGC
jgi:hypothetical protein